MSMYKWKQFLSMPAPQGGAGAVLVEEHEWKASNDMVEQQHRSSPDMNQMEEAKKDVRNIYWQLVRAKNRRGVQPGDVPAEGWRLALDHRRVKLPRGGVGCDNVSSGGFRWRERVAEMVAVCNASGWMPHQLHCAEAWLIPKPGKTCKKHGCKAFRAVFGLPTFAKAWTKTIWRQQELQDVAVHAYACKGRRREMAVTVQLAHSHRLAKAGVNHGTKMYDASNAFLSVQSEHVLETTAGMEPPHHDDFMQQHMSNMTFWLTVDGERALFRPTSGIFPGASVATDVYGYASWTQLEEWMREEGPVDKKYLWGNSITCEGRRVPVGMTSFVDDIAKKIIAGTPATLLARDKVAQESLSKHMERIGVQMNHEKAALVASFVGKGSAAARRELFDVSGNRVTSGVLTVARYLGPMYTADTSASIEVDRGVDAAEAAFNAFRGFWWKKADFGIVSLVFKNIYVLNIMSGLTSFVLAKHHYSKLQSAIASKVRKITRGAGHHKVCKCSNVPCSCESADVKHVALSNEEMLALVDLPPVHVDMASQRLRLYQCIAKEPENYEQYLCALFHEWSWQTNGYVSPWVTQMMNDIDMLRFICDEDTVRQMSEEPVRIFTDEDMRERFLQIAIPQLKAMCCSVDVPPPEALLRCAPCLVEDEDCGVFECMYKTAEGVVCGRVFPSSRALRAHVMKASKTGGEHNVLQGVEFVLTNQCVFCGSLFASVYSAKNHVRNALVTRRCHADRSLAAKPLVEVTPLCKACGCEFQTLKEYYVHLHMHMEPIDEIVFRDIKGKACFICHSSQSQCKCKNVDDPTTSGLGQAPAGRSGKGATRQAGKNGGSSGKRRHAGGRGWTTTRREREQRRRWEERRSNAVGSEHAQPVSAGKSAQRHKHGRRSATDKKSNHRRGAQGGQAVPRGRQGSHSDRQAEDGVATPVRLAGGAGHLIRDGGRAEVARPHHGHSRFEILRHRCAAQRHHQQAGGGDQACESQQDLQARHSQTGSSSQAWVGRRNMLEVNVRHDAQAREGRLEAGHGTTQLAGEAGAEDRRGQGQARGNDGRGRLKVAACNLKTKQVSAMQRRRGAGDDAGAANIQNTGADSLVFPEFEHQLSRSERVLFVKGETLLPTRDSG
eukprot:TRINITY_DN15664_c0_g3_i3.p1 TRINITY_DN15664_c0_g3~~TRINITY_DN15664_c0_g3_i3.p1  ORF type:complete len:1120 (+),score=84.77 TRINITY_DN15664_c0_g3_i3:306-3665(+)